MILFAKIQFYFYFFENILFSKKLKKKWSQTWEVARREVAAHEAHEPPEPPLEGAKVAQGSWATSARLLLTNPGGPLCNTFSGCPQIPTPWGVGIWEMCLKKPKHRGEIKKRPNFFLPAAPVLFRPSNPTPPEGSPIHGF